MRQVCLAQPSLPCVSISMSSARLAILENDLRFACKLSVPKPQQERNSRCLNLLRMLCSVLEPGRTLTLAEKGGAGAEVIKAAPGFRLVATMNPGG